MTKIVPKYVAYSLIEEAYIEYYRFKYRGGCDFTRFIEIADMQDTEEQVLRDLENYEVDMCQVLKINVIVEDEGE